MYDEMIAKREAEIAELQSKIEENKRYVEFVFNGAFNPSMSCWIEAE